MEQSSGFTPESISESGLPRPVARVVAGDAEFVTVQLTPPNGTVREVIVHDLSDIPESQGGPAEGEF